MSDKKLHPSIEEFKGFVKKHPGLVKEVRREEHTWQELYEDWYLLGSDDPRWDKYKTGEAAESKSEKSEEKSWISQLTGMIKKMDANQVEQQLGKLSEAIGTLQGVLSQFNGQGQEPSPPQSGNEAPRNPFAFRKD